MNVRVFLIACATLATTVGCNPKGTCVSKKELSDLGAECVTNTNKMACEEMSDGPTFYAEDGAAGEIRCKSLGYDDIPGQQRAKDAKELHIYYKKSAAGAPKK
jgi:hypothetical protein